MPVAKAPRQPEPKLEFGFAWRDGRSIPQADPEVLGKSLHDLAAKLGHRTYEQVRTKEIYEEAQNPNSPWHEQLEWDDRVAGKKYRYAQIRRIVCSLSYKIIQPGKREIKTLAFVSVTVEGRRSYVPTTIAQRHKQFLDQMITDARVGLEGWRRRYESINGFPLEALRNVDEAMQRLKKRGAR
jgi:hypothetical protein